MYQLLLKRARRLGFTIAAAIALGASAAASAAAGATVSASTPAVPAYVDDELLVAFEPGTPASEIAAAHRRNGVRIQRTIDSIGVQVLSIPAGSVPSLLQIYRNNPNVKYAEPNYLRPLILPGEGSFGNNIDVISEQWSLHNQGQTLHTLVDPVTGESPYPYTALDADIDMDEAWAIEQGDPNVLVAVPDSGVDCAHGDLVRKCAHNEDYVTPTVDPYGTPIPELIDRIGHGTHVAGTIGMDTDNDVGGAGIGWNVRIGSFKVCYQVEYVGIVIGSACQDADIAAAIARAIQLGYHIINMSFGQAAPSAVLKAALDDAVDAGLILVAAAGNNGNWQKFYPAAYPEVISVGATTSWDDRAGFSTFSRDDDDWVDLLAPGDSILATVPNVFCSPTATQCFGWKRGTSMASPHAAGVAALVLSYLQRTDAANANRLEVRRRMQDCADVTGAMGQDMLVWSRYGRVNAAAALTCGDTGGDGGGGGDTGGGGGGGTGPAGAHVAELTASSTSAGGNAWSSTVTVRVHDINHASMAGVTVSFATNAGTTSACETGALGACTTPPLLQHKKNGSVTYTISSLSASDYTPGDNHDPSDSPIGESVTAYKP